MRPTRVQAGLFVAVLDIISSPDSGWRKKPMPRDNVSTIGPRASATSSLSSGAANRHAEEATGPRSAKWPAYVPPFDKIRKMLGWQTSGSELTQIPQALKENIRLII